MKTRVTIYNLPQMERQDGLTCWSGDASPENIAAAQFIVEAIFEGATLAESWLLEATVHLPRRGRFWVAVFTGATGGQTWRSTRLTNKKEALALARKWETEAATQRALLGNAAQQTRIRFRRWAGGFTQREVAIILGMSERGVRAVEKRAVQKLVDNLELRDLWQKFLTGELAEADSSLSPAEAAALLDLTRTVDEYELIKEILSLA